MTNANDMTSGSGAAGGSLRDDWTTDWFQFRMQHDTNILIDNYYPAGNQAFYDVIDWDEFASSPSQLGPDADASGFAPLTPRADAHLDVETTNVITTMGEGESCGI